jgi:integrase
VWVAESGNDQELEKRFREGKLLPRIRLHDLRHLHASIAIRSGMDPKRLADRLGHKNANLTLNVCTHPFDSEREQESVSVLGVGRALN